MIDATSFKYPAKPHRYRHGPNGYERYSSYRPWLRDEFDFRCVYCLFRERWCPILKLQIDHFIPQILDRSKTTSYSNLIYACPTCNTLKSSHRLPSPLKALTSKAISVNEDGTIQATTTEARRIVRILGLDSPEFNEWRRLIIDIVAMAAKVANRSKSPQRKLYRELLGYPTDLPDLSKLDPPKNTRPAGVHESTFARRQRSELPEVY